LPWQKAQVKTILSLVSPRVSFFRPARVFVFRLTVVMMSPPIPADSK